MLDRIEVHVSLDGTGVAGILHANVTNTNCFGADTFSVTFAMGPYPLGDIVFWSGISGGLVQVSVTAASAVLPVSLITGLADTIAIDPINGTVTIEGRDLSAALVDAYRQQDFVNQSASEIVTSVAAAHGLDASVSPTTASVGRYYGDGFTRLSVGQFSHLRSDWDLIVKLARENACDAYVQGSTLYFQPANPQQNPSLQISPQNLLKLNYEGSFIVPPTTVARVRSWNSQSMASYDSVTVAAGTSSSQPPQPFMFSASNLTSSQVEIAASNYTNELKRLRGILSLDMPIEMTAMPRVVFLLTGTKSALDGSYQIDTVERVFNSLSGSRQSVRAFRVIG